MVSHKLLHYFMAHVITVPSSYPLGTLLHNKEATSQIGKWVMELAPFDLIFIICMTIKSQALADFVVEWTRN